MSSDSGVCGWRPAQWAGRHPLMSTSEHMRLRVSAPPRFVIRNRRTLWPGRWRQLDRRCLGASVCRGQREECASG